MAGAADAAAPVPPSGEQIEVAHGRQRLVVVTGGGGIRSYRAGGRDLLDGYAEDEPCAGARGQLLIPWPNRLRGGRYSFQGRERQVALTDPEHGGAIHGFTREHTWTVVERDRSSAVLGHRLLAQSGYPHVLDVRVRYQLDGTGLTVQVDARNAGAGPAPYASGAHPYLRAAEGLIDECELRIPAQTRLLTDKARIPVGQESVAGTAYDFREPREIGGMKIDAAFSDLIRDGDGRVRTVLRDPRSGVSLTAWMDAAHEFLMIFTGDTLAHRRRQGLGVEPMTSPPNSFATGDHLTVLQPGEMHSAAWGIAPGGIDL